MELIQSLILDLMRSRKGKCKYSKVSSLVRRQFIHKVVSKSCTIKQAARQYKINYSTAKTIFRLYKNKTALRTAADETNCWRLTSGEDIDSSNDRKQCRFREVRRSPLKLSPGPRQRDDYSPRKILKRYCANGGFSCIDVISTIGSLY